MAKHKTHSLRCQHPDYELVHAPAAPFPAQIPNPGLIKAARMHQLFGPLPSSATCVRDRVKVLPAACPKAILRVNQ